MAVADPKIAPRRSDIDTYLLSNRVCSINDAPDPFFAADLYHFFPWKKDPWVGRDGVYHSHYLLGVIRSVGLTW